MKKLLMLSILISFSFKGQQQPDKIIPESANKMINPIKGDQQAALKGYKMYKKVCWVCHGNNGNGKGPQAAEIATKVANFKDPIVVGRSDGALFWWINTGGNDMQPFKDALTPDQVWEIVNYIRKVQDKL